MALAQNNAATFDSLAAKTEIMQDLIKTTNVNTPLFTDYMKAVPETASRIEWFDQFLKVDKIALAATHTSGSGSFQLATSGLTNPYSVIPGVTKIMLGDGTARFNVTDWDSATSTATVTLDQGTDSTLTYVAANPPKIRLIRDTKIGGDAGAQSDVSYATSDYNYISNFSYTIRLGNPQKNGQISHYIDEISFENQLANNTPEALRILEFRAWKDFRVAGDNGAARNGNTIQAGDGSSSGGVLTLANARGMYTASSGSAVISEDTLETDVIELRGRGAFNTVTDTERNMSTASCDVYCSEATLGDLNKNVRMLRDPTEAFNGTTLGTFSSQAYVNGILLNFKVTDGLEDNEIVYVPRQDLIEIRVLRMLEEEPAIYGGDNEARMYNVTYATCVKNPWLLGHRSNLVRY